MELGDFPHKKQDICSFHWLRHYLLDPERPQTGVALFNRMARKLIGDYTLETLPQDQRDLTRNDLEFILLALHPDKIDTKEEWSPLKYLCDRVREYLTPAREEVQSPFKTRNNFRFTLMTALEEVRFIRDPVDLAEYNEQKNKFVQEKLKSGQHPRFFYVDLTGSD